MKRLMLLIFLMVFAIVATITPTAFYNVTENDSGSNKARVSSYDEDENISCRLLVYEGIYHYDE